MSGGKWNYIQFQLTEVIEDIEQEIEKNGKPLTEEEIKNHWYGKEWFEKHPEDKFHYKYPDEIINEFKKGLDHIKKAQIYMQRMDWLFSGDDGDESFLSRLKEELNND